jgi:hypothetical protein
MSDLTDEAKKEIADAVRIVREDKILKFLKENKNVSTSVPASDPSSDPSNPIPDPSTVDPDKPIPPPVKPPEPPKPKKKGLYWGDTDDE